MFLLRPARTDDLEALLELAHYLDSPNLPAREDFLAARLERSVLGVRARHVTFQLGANPDGPTELGALVLRPEVRRKPGSPGKLVAWGRFAYVARHPERFETELLAEMRAALDSEGRSAFWESFGKRFTGLRYDEADRLSMQEKEFVLDLFPETRFYASLLDPEVAARLGEVHEESRPAVRLLEQAGFRWIGEIDPFDAGPFYGAATAEVIPVRETRTLRVAAGSPEEEARAAIVSVEDARGFRAVATRTAEAGEEILIPDAALARLEVTPGARVARTPLPVRRRGPRG
jgi:arginine N-succinyltransferase